LIYGALACALGRVCNRRNRYIQFFCKVLEWPQLRADISCLIAVDLTHVSGDGIYGDERNVPDLGHQLSNFV
jgi:hypothetical protein